MKELSIDIQDGHYRDMRITLVGLVVNGVTITKDNIDQYYVSLMEYEYEKEAEGRTKAEDKQIVMAGTIAALKYDRKVLRWLLRGALLALAIVMILWLGF